MDGPRIRFQLRPFTTIFYIYLILSQHFLRIALGDTFQSGQSSSVAVIPTTYFSHINADNLAIDGLMSACVNCGWIFTVAGNDSPGYYTLPRFGTFNVGTDNVGSANVGSNNIGYGNYGTGNIGRLNTGTGNVGYLNYGEYNSGAFNYGNLNIGDRNIASDITTSLPNIGYNNTQCSACIGYTNDDSTSVIGEDLTGQLLIGSGTSGYASIGNDQSGYLNTGIDNVNSDAASVVGATGVANVGEGNIGYNNTGLLLIGMNNVGDGSVGISNEGTFQVGTLNIFNSMASPNPYSLLNIGFNQTGYFDVGGNNYGYNLTGYNLTGADLTGADFSDPTLNPFVPVGFTFPVLPSSTLPDGAWSFSDPTSTIVNSNIGSTLNILPAVEVVRISSGAAASGDVVSFSTAWQINLDQPAVLSVVDLGCAGEIINVYDEGSLILVTSFPPGYSESATASLNCSQLSISVPDEALADYSYSRGFVTLPAGYHRLSFELSPGTASFNGTALAFRLDTIRQSICERCTAPLPFLRSGPNGPFGPPRGSPVILPNCQASPSRHSSSNLATVAAKPANTGQGGHVRPAVASTPVAAGGRRASKADENPSDSDSHASSPPPGACVSRNFAIQPHKTASYADAQQACHDLGYAGLARPENSGPARSELLALLIKCSAHMMNSAQESSNEDLFQQPLWIGSNWDHQSYPSASNELCLQLISDQIRATPDCHYKQGLVCQRNEDN